MADVRKMLCLSTAHVTEGTRDWLNEQGEKAGRYHREHREPDASPALHMASHTYGWIVWAYSDPPTEWDTPDMPDGVKANLAPIFMRAKGSGCDWVNLDCDAERDPALPVYEW